MKLDNKLLHQFFVEKGILFLYHANSISSSITYIKNKGLLSRGDVEDSIFFQTAQRSDEQDKEFDVWFDVFLDTADLHGYFSRQNKYGPVLFKFDINCILNDDLDIWITKDNPMYWSGSNSLNDNYFQTIDELRDAWGDNHDRHRKMITIRKPSKPILFNSLNQIMLDNPKVILNCHIDLLTEAGTALKLATQGEAKLREKLILRSCNNNCFCQRNYLDEVPAETLEKMFLQTN